MSTDVTDSAHTICLETDARAALANILKDCLGSSAALTLVLLAGSGASVGGSHALSYSRSALDVIERIAQASVRRTDVVFRCGAHCCALVLPGAEIEGALRVISRLRLRLEGWHTEGYSLLMGIAAAPEQATEVHGLMSLACSSLACLILPKGRGDTTQAGVGRMEIPAVLQLPRSGRSTGRLSSVSLSHEEMAAKRRRRPKESHTSLPPATIVQVQARALGIPYLAPPERISSSVLNLLPQEVMQQLLCLPIGRDRNSLTVALADPTDQKVLQQLEQITGMKIFPVMTDPHVLKTLAQLARTRHAQQIKTPQRDSGTTYEHSCVDAPMPKIKY